MLFRVVLGSLLLIGVAHAEPGDVPTDGVTATNDTAQEPGRHRIDGVLGTGGAGARYLLGGERLALELQAFGEVDGVGRRGATAKLQLARFDAFGIEHELVTGVGLVQASTDAEPLAATTMTTHTTAVGRLHGEHRFLSAYINDTVRFIRGLDVTGGLMVRQWQTLGGDSTITYGSGPPMEVQTPDTSSLMSPTVSITAHVTESLALVARTYLDVHEIGTTVSRGRVALQARAFQSDLGTGVASEASVQPVAPVIASVGYLQTSSTRRASAALTFSDARVAGITARYDSDSHLDALAVRELRRGLSGFLGVEDLLADRMIQIGVRGYFASGTP